jgi:diadenylate cyclase
MVKREKLLYNESEDLIGRKAMDAINAVMDYILRYAQLFRLADIIDIGIVALITYYLLGLIRETRAVQLVKGIAILFLVLQLSAWMKLTVLNYLLKTTMQVGMFAIVVIFQPELRSILERVGRSKVGKLMDISTYTGAEDKASYAIHEIVTAAMDLSKAKTGALIVLERETKLGEVMKTGTTLNADVSAALLENIFVVNTPLHDGAVIVRGDKILMANCILPLTSNGNLSLELGTRHRAAIGISEASDAVVVVVSEETGKISVAVNGTLTRSMSEETLTKALTKMLRRRVSPPDTFDRIKIWKVNKNSSEK